jgi:carboxyl-terminal processing protease
MLDGEEGREVALKILDSSGKARQVLLRCEEYASEPVRGLYRDNDGHWVWRIPSPALPGKDPNEKTDNGPVNYIRVAEFSRRTRGDLDRTLRKLGSARGLVLDLRDNPGGFLDEGIAVADMFLEAGTIVHVQKRAGRIETHDAHADTQFSAVPLVVLINGNTSSAAELVAAALAANCRAILVGRRTQGKGCVQTMIDLKGDLGKLNLTTAEFFADSLRPIQKKKGSDTWGVDPEVVLAMNNARRRAMRRLRRELDVVPAPAKDAPGPATAPAETQDDKLRHLLESDIQLARAVALLRDRAGYDRVISRLRLLAEQRARVRERTEALSRKGLDDGS